MYIRTEAFECQIEMPRERNMRSRIIDEPSESGKSVGKSKFGKLMPEIILISPEGQITLKQLEVLRAISNERSQNRAAARLKISAAVLNRQLKELERKAGTQLVKTSMRGSELTAEGKQMLHIIDIISQRMERSKELVVGCTRISQMVVERICSKLAERGTRARVIVADDESNIKMAAGGLLDIVFFDDPIHAYDYPEEDRIHEVTRDFLIHCDRGKRYAQLMSGPQRIGFDTLKMQNKEFEIRKVVFSPEELIRSKYSFFVSQILLNIRKLELPSDVRIRTIPYTIYAIETTNHKDIHEFFNCMSPRQYYPIG